MYQPGESKTQPAVHFHAITKRFPGVAALRDVTFDVQPGTCHALMGENGAGKSTLGKLLAGIDHPDAGHFEVHGTVCHFRHPWDAQRAGIGIVHQELSYCPNLSVAENVCLHHLPRRGPWLNRKAMLATAQQFLDQVGADCDIHAEMGTLTTGQCQMVQIAAALAMGSRILILDEPTSSLSLAESRHLEELIAQLRQQGTTILYVSHRMEEVFRICDNVTVLRDGQHVATMPLAETNADAVVRMMIGRDLAKTVPQHLQKNLGDERLRVESFSSPGKFQNVSFALRAGEVLGVAGLVGSGRSEVALGIFGLDSQAAGQVLVNGQAVHIRNPQQAMASGIGLVSEDRKRQGMVPDMSCLQNSTLAAMACPGGTSAWRRLLRCPLCPRSAECLQYWGLLRLGRERRWVLDRFQQLRVRAASPHVPISTLSGGNQQKVMLARCLIRRCNIVILDEPTRGVDVGAKAEIHRFIDELASEGHAILLISSELPEVLQLSTRILVMREGRVARILERSEANEETVMQWMAGCSSNHLHGGDPNATTTQKQPIA